MEQEYIEIGMTAQRDPKTGKFGEPVPLFIRATDNAIAGEQNLIDEIGNVFANMMKHYIHGCRKAGIAI